MGECDCGNARQSDFGDRVVVGIESEKAKELMSRLYRPVMLNNFRVIRSSFFIDRCAGNLIYWQRKRIVCLQK